MLFEIWLLLLTTKLASSIDNYFSNHFIMRINLMNTTWKAGHNFPEGTIVDRVKSLLGVLPNRKLFLPPTLPKDDSPVQYDLPENFDSRDRWPMCPSVSQILDQGRCQSCWAFGAVEAMSDRVCVQSEGQEQFEFSPDNLVSCCETCGNGCSGGYPGAAWQYWADKGIVSGGLFDGQGCQPYRIPSCRSNDSAPECNGAQQTPSCLDSCGANHSNAYADDLYKGSKVYSIQNDEEMMRRDIYTNGPVEAVFSVYSDFLSYKSGVYQHVTGEFLGFHAAKILGWGRENDTLYWLAANSWNTDWGDGGFFKILRGADHCGIESEVIAGLPELKKSFVEQ